MSVIARTRATVWQRQLLKFILPAVKLPLFVKLAILGFALTGVIFVGLVMPLGLNAQLSNFFTDYTEIFPGQSRSAVMALNFSCDSNNRSGNYQYCTRAPANGPFSLVTVILSDGIITQADFVMEDRVEVGELVVLWGRPVVHFYGESVSFEWTNTGVVASGRTANGKFSYFLPVHHVSFASKP
jgi:hypothetical protein